jgi:hypothetical protein
MPATTTSPWNKAVSRLSDKTVVGSRLRSAEWADVPLALREQAFFSAGVEHARTLSAMQEKLLQGAEQLRPGGTGMDRSRFVADLRNLLGAAPGDSGDLTDLTSVRRLELIWNFQTQEAHAHAAHQADMDPNLLDAFPAYRLVRVESRRVPRDWFERWGEAGAAVGWEGASRRAMVALKTSPIWARLSRFGRPWPPFDFGSGMGLEDVERDEAEALGLLPRGEPPADRLRRLREGSAQAQRDWAEGLRASVKGIKPEVRENLALAFGDQVSFTADGAAVWTRRQPYTDWQAQGLESAKTWQPSEPMPARIAPDEGRAQLEQGVTVRDPAGQPVTFDRGTLSHWDGYADAPQRPAFLRAALRTIEAPIEKWTQATQDAYIALFARPQGAYRGVVVFAQPGGLVRTYFVKDASALDAARKGVKVQTWSRP